MRSSVASGRRTRADLPRPGRYRAEFPHVPESLNMPATVFLDLVAEAPVPARGILSQTLSNENGIELVLFAFAPGEQLSEHTSARPAIIHVLSGEADLTVGVDAQRAIPGTWVRMPADTCLLYTSDAADEEDSVDL